MRDHAAASEEGGTPEAHPKLGAAWLEAESAYRAIVDEVFGRPDRTPTKDDYLALAQARARADHKQARYFRHVLRA